MSECFFEMVKKWTISDYKTPGIKAEVILDMLISDFIGDLLSYHLKEKMTLLTKEFPIPTNEDNYLNAKVDYLACTENKMLLVELKTANDSYDRIQNERMREIIGKYSSDSLIGFYKDICNLKNGNSSDSKKYKYSQKEFDKRAQLDKISAVDFLYILLTDNKRIENGRKIILADHCSDSGFISYLDENRRELWRKIGEILLGCANAFREQV